MTVWKPSYIAGAFAFAGMAACIADPAASTSTRITDQHDGLACDIAITETRQHIELSALIQTDAAIIGEYSFVIHAFGPAGSSTSSQGGGFETLGPATETLATARVNNRPNGGYRARLVVKVDQSTICEDEV